MTEYGSFHEISEVNNGHDMSKQRQTKQREKNNPNLSVYWTCLYLPATYEFQVLEKNPVENLSEVIKEIRGINDTGEKDICMQKIMCTNLYLTILRIFGIREQLREKQEVQNFILFDFATMEIQERMF